jgi:hypothetical protein
MTEITIAVATERLNRHPDFTAIARLDRIDVKRFGRPAGYITHADLQSIGHTATGWGKNLTKGAYPAWQAITTA